MVLWLTCLHGWIADEQGRSRGKAQQDPTTSRISPGITPLSPSIITGGLAASLGPVLPQEPVASVDLTPLSFIHGCKVVRYLGA